jgi:hypothetical protein
MIEITATSALTHRSVLIRIWQADPELRPINMYASHRADSSWVSVFADWNSYIVETRLDALDRLLKLLA